MEMHLRPSSAPCSLGGACFGPAPGADASQAFVSDHGEALPASGACGCHGGLIASGDPGPAGPVDTWAVRRLTKRRDALVIGRPGPPKGVPGHPRPFVGDSCGIGA
jgi:hypothetical protein